MPALSSTQDPNTKSGMVIPASVAAQALAIQAAARAAAASSSAPAPSSEGDNKTHKDEWKDKGKISIDVKEIIDRNIDTKTALKVYDGVVTTLEVTVEVLKTISLLINVFQSDITNLFAVLNTVIQVLIDQLEKMLISIASTGIYALPMWPDISPLDPAFKPGGGFPAVMAKVNHSLTNMQDPNRPIFYEGDYVGAIMVMLNAGTNVGDLIHDMELLAKFFGTDAPTVKFPPPVGLTAKPGLYAEDEKDSPNFGDSFINVVSSTFTGKKVLGIMLSWKTDDLPGLSGFNVYRSKVPKGIPVIDANGKFVQGQASAVKAATVLGEYADLLFNNGKPVFVDNDPGSPMHFLDLEVISGETYYYKVVPTFQMSDGTNYPAEAANSYISAKAVACIPDDLLQTTYETPSGLLNGLATGDPPYWSNMTLRGLLGPSFDVLLEALTGLADRLKGVTISSKNHFEKLLKLLDKWVKKLKELLVLIKNVLASLEALKFSANAMMLMIPSAKGGIPGLKEQINNAGFEGDLKEFLAETDTLCNIYGAVLIVVGAPTANTFTNFVGVAKAEGTKLKNAGKMQALQNQIKKQRAFYTQAAESKDADSADKVMGFLVGLLGGGQK
jgi:hypothetical protein